MKRSKSKTLIQSPKVLQSSASRGFTHNKSIKFNYIWPGSIPESWDKIMSRKNIPKLRIEKNFRNTLVFLEETQKYITKICKPDLPIEVELYPSAENRRIENPSEDSPRFSPSQFDYKKSARNSPNYHEILKNSVSKSPIHNEILKNSVQNSPNHNEILKNSVSNNQNQKEILKNSVSNSPILQKLKMKLVLNSPSQKKTSLSHRYFKYSNFKIKSQVSSPVHKSAPDEANNVNLITRRLIANK